MSNSSTGYERGHTHGQHSVRFYWILAAVLVSCGFVGGIVLCPESWPLHRGIFTGVMMSVLAGYCVFAWHWLLGPVRAEPLESPTSPASTTSAEQPEQ